MIVKIGVEGLNRNFFKIDIYMVNKYIKGVLIFCLRCKLKLGKILG